MSKEENEKKCRCPFCDGELEEQGFPFCKTCNLSIKKCKYCGKPVPAETTVCPECGQS
jgi:hypothetical protein